MPSNQRIRERREAKGLKQLELAFKMRRWFPTWDATTIHKIEIGKRSVKADELPYFAAALGCSVQDLVDQPPDGPQ